MRLANYRTTKVLKALRHLNKLGKNSRNYDFAKADVDAIVTTIRAELEVMERTMDPPGHQLDVEFDLLNEIHG